MENKNTVSVLLSGEWELYYAPETGGKNAETLPDDWQAWNHIPAGVPGNVQADLYAAGAEGDPYYDTTLLDYAKYEYYQWVLTRKFLAPELPAGCRPVLRFDGIDTIADISLNGMHVGRTENMFTEHVLDVAEALLPGRENEVTVHIRSAMNYARSREYTIGMRGTAHRNEICWIRKAPHTFGWDIAPRLVTAGLWRDVALEYRPATRITETYYATPEFSENGEGIWLEYALRFETDADTLEGFSVRLTGECGDHCFSDEQPAWFVSMNYETLVRAPKLWWPLGYGDQPLYTVKLELLHNGVTVDTRTERIGMRTVGFERSFERGSQKFRFYINGVPVMIRGTNWVPIDAMHGQDGKRLERSFALVPECGCNMVRSWGGGVYESDRFFDLCDENGVMVWQDFALGNTNYPQGETFAETIEEEAGKVIRRLRNHVSLTIWSGDNEIDTKNMGFRFPHYDARYNRVAHETLVRALQAHDPYRHFVRSSPEIPDGYHVDDVPEQHTWGPRAYYKDDFYKNSSAVFIGEAGYHGCPAPSSLRRFLKPENVWPMDNDAWALHSTEDIRIEPVLGMRNDLMANQVRLLCADPVNDLETFALISQFSQAEAVKFFVEHTRCLKWRRTGIIWWNMIDCWPQISDAVTDYYYRKKLAWHFIRRVQRPCLVMLDEINGWQRNVVLMNDTLQQTEIAWQVSDADSGAVLAKGCNTVRAGENLPAASMEEDPSAQRLLVIRYTVNGREYANHYLTGFPKYRLEDLKRWIGVICALPEAFEPEL